MQSYIGQIIELNVIPEADKILSATVIAGKGGRWHGVVDKSFEVNNYCVVFLPDSIVPENENLEFMAKHKWIVKQKRFRGAPSEVLITKIGIFPQLKNQVFDIGDCVDDLIGTKKYEKPIETSMIGVIAGDHPSYVPKTDEHNFQTVDHIRNHFKENKTEVYVSVKYDGTSLGIIHRDGEFLGCSRNNSLVDDPNIGVWKIIYEYDLKNKLPKFGNIALQMEGIGPKIQKNPCGLLKLEPRVFNVYDIEKHRYYDFKEAYEITTRLGLPFVEILYTGEYNFDDRLQTYPDGFKYPANQKQIEGVVIRATKEQRIMGDRSSFKVISLLY